MTFEKAVEEKKRLPKDWDVYYQNDESNSEISNRNSLEMMLPFVKNNT